MARFRFSSLSRPMSSTDAHLTCRMCGQNHRLIPLAPGERAECARCGTVLARGRRSGPDAALAFAVTGLILIVPAAMLPFITAEKLGNEQIGFLFSGVRHLWENSMALLAVPVFLFGGLLPVALMGILVALLAPTRFGWQSPNIPWLRRMAQALGGWAMPEVQVLAVLVALMKLGSLVDLTIGAGFWCYAAMSLSLLLAWRNFELDPAASGSAMAPP
jgi:paraquat-inducible protein A